MFGGGDCAFLSSSDPATSGFTDPGPEPVVPSEVCMLRLAAGKPDGGGCCDGAFFDFDLKRNDMARPALAPIASLQAVGRDYVSGGCWSVFLVISYSCMPLPSNANLFLSLFVAGQVVVMIQIYTKNWR